MELAPSKDNDEVSHAERVVHKSGRWADFGSSSSCFASTSNIICRYKLLDTKKLSLPSKMFIQHLPMKKTNESHVMQVNNSELGLLVCRHAS